MTLYEMLLYFFIYGILGWCTEVAFAAAKERRFVNRGFLNGPICPIYGVGVVTVTAFLDPLRDQWVLLYLASTILVTLIEGLTGFVLDRLFHHKWWDYTGMPFNIGGYVCLVFSLVWGVACVTIVKVIHPVVRDLCLLLPHVLGILILTGCVCAMAADLLVTVNSILKWNRQLDALDKIAADLRELPQVLVADMREELRKGNRSILSGRLEEMIRDRLEKKEQIMLFLNRRGYAGFVSCRACGYVVKCPHCDVSLSAHRNGRLVCHYCGYEEPAIQTCPSCGSSYIGGFKAGTQQVEEMIHKRFPEARVLRMDLDTTRKKDGYEKILETFSDEEADILIGTQMIVKGHDFPNVTLVGILAADLSLYSDDYRSAERTFQLLTQAAGRAGRGGRSGEVVIQTYSPDHYAVRMAASQNYEGFYEEEMRYRSLMGYPPASHLLAVLMTGADEEGLMKAAGYLKEFLHKIDPRGRIQVIGPASPYVGKVSDVYRRVLYLKEEEEAILIEAKNRMEQYIEANRGFEPFRIQFDLDPMGVF